MANLSRFVNYAQSIVNDAVHLRIVTAVGDFSVSQTDKKWDIKASSGENSAISTDINLVQGDIVNLISKDFADQPSAVRDFHSAQVEKAENIVRANIAALKGIIEVLVMAERHNKGQVEQPDASPGSPETDGSQ